MALAMRCWHWLLDVDSNFVNPFGGVCGKQREHHAQSSGRVGTTTTMMEEKQKLYEIRQISPATRTRQLNDTSPSRHNHPMLKNSRRLVLLFQLIIKTIIFPLYIIWRRKLKSLHDKTLVSVTPWSRHLQLWIFYFCALLTIKNNHQTPLSARIIAVPGL